MGAALGLLIGGPEHLYTVLFGIVCILLETFISYPRYAAVLKWATLSLFAYMAVVFAANVPWGTALARTLVPHLVFDDHHAMALVAILGTTISPYLFFWQAGQEVEELRRRHVKALASRPAMPDQNWRVFARTPSWAWEFRTSLLYASSSLRRRR
jgi:Mn2+/Fe2+ NRAMP family transporter